VFADWSEQYDRKNETGKRGKLHKVGRQADE